MWVGIPSGGKFCWFGPDVSVGSMKVHLLLLHIILTTEEAQHYRGHPVIGGHMEVDLLTDSGRDQ